MRICPSGSASEFAKDAAQDIRDLSKGAILFHCMQDMWHEVL